MQGLETIEELIAELPSYLDDTVAPFQDAVAAYGANNRRVGFSLYTDTILVGARQCLRLHQQAALERRQGRPLTIEERLTLDQRLMQVRDTIDTVLRCADHQEDASIVAIFTQVHADIEAELMISPLSIANSV